MPSLRGLGLWINSLVLGDDSSRYVVVINFLAFMYGLCLDELGVSVQSEGAQERRPRTTGPDPHGQVPNLRGPDLGLYKWKPELQQA